MADWSMFSPEHGGGRLFEEDQQKNAVTMLNAMSTASLIDERKAMTQAHQVETQQKQLQMQEAARKQKIATEMDNRVRQLALEDQDRAQKSQQTPEETLGLVSPKSKAPESAAAVVTRYGRDLTARFGTPGLKILETGVKLYKEEAETSEKGAQQAKAEQEVAIKNSAIVAGAYRNVKSPEQKAAVDKWLADRNITSPYSKEPYSPALIKTVQEEAITQRDKSLIDYRNSKLSEQRRVDNVRIDVLKSVKDVNATRAAFNRVKADAEAKGGKVINAPNKTEIEGAEKYALSKLGLTNKSDLDETSRKNFEDAARYLADAAKGYRTRNKGVDENASFNQTFDPDNWKMLQRKDIMKGDFKDKFHFVAGGKTPEAAVPMPSKPEDRDADRWYTLSDGRVGKWGKGIDPVTKKEGFGLVEVREAPKEPKKPDTGRGVADSSGHDDAEDDDGED